MDNFISYRLQIQSYVYFFNKKINKINQNASENRTQIRLFLFHEILFAPLFFYPTRFSKFIKPFQRTEVKLFIWLSIWYTPICMYTYIIIIICMYNICVNMLLLLFLLLYILTFLNHSIQHHINLKLCRNTSSAKLKAKLIYERGVIDILCNRVSRTESIQLRIPFETINHSDRKYRFWLSPYYYPTVLKSLVVYIDSPWTIIKFGLSF